MLHEQVEYLDFFLLKSCREEVIAQGPVGGKLEVKRLVVKFVGLTRVVTADVHLGPIQVAVTIAVEVRFDHHFGKSLTTRELTVIQSGDAHTHLSAERVRPIREPLS